MRHINTSIKNKNEKGFSLIELMMALAIGMVITASIGSLFGRLVKHNADVLKMTRLNQDLRASMLLMSNDIRRAGYWGFAHLGIGGAAVNPFTQGLNELTVAEHTGETVNSCVTYAYDRNDDGIVDDNELLGFRLNSGVLEMAMQLSSCTATTDWEQFSDPNTVNITSVEFVTNHKTIDIDGDSVNDIILKEVEVTLSGELLADPSVSRTIVETIRIRNESII